MWQYLLAAYVLGIPVSVATRAFWYCVRAQRLGWPQEDHYRHDSYGNQCGEHEFTRALCSCETSRDFERCYDRGTLLIWHAFFGSFFRAFVWPIVYPLIAAEKTAFKLGDALKRRDLVRAEAAKQLEAAKTEEQRLLTEAKNDIEDALKKRRDRP